ncbi:MAG: SRPBCC family protein [Solirubrobacteraceae bacterium]
MIVHTVEIARSPADVFAYLDQLDRHGEWQPAIQEVTKVSEGPTGVGTKATERRKLPGGEREMTYEITEHDPPRRTAFRGLDGPVRPVGVVTVEPLDGGARSSVTIQFSLEGHGIGKLIAPFARMDAKRTITKDQELLKERLEAGA